MSRRVLVLLLGLLATVPAAQAQWSAGLETGADRAWRFAEPLDPDQAGLLVRPTMSWPVAFRLARGGAGLQVAVVASRASAGLELDDGSLAVAVHPAFRILTVAPEASLPVWRLRGGAALRAVAALPAERWSYVGVDEEPRWRLGAAGGMALELPVGESVSVRAGVMLGRVFGSPIAETEMTQEYAPATLWRRGFRAGLTWRFR